MSRTPILDPSVLTDFVSHTAHTFARATQKTNPKSETYHHHTGQHSNTVTLSDNKNPPVSAQLFRDYGDHGLSAKGHDLLYFQRDVMPNYLSHMYRHVLAQEMVQMALLRAELPVDASSLSTRLTVNAYRLLDPKTGLHAGFPPHVDLSSNGKLTLILSGTEERMSFFRLRRPTEGPLSREAIALGENRQELTLPAGTLTIIHGEALTQWAHEVLPMVRDPKYDYFSWVFGVRKK